MATRRLSIGAGEVVENMVEAVGAVTATKSIELTFDTSQTLLSGGTRGMTRSELIDALNKLHDYIMRMPFPPST